SRTPGMHNAYMKNIPNDILAQSKFDRSRSDATGRMLVHALPGGFGAELTRIDLRAPMADRLRTEIHRALRSHALLVVRRQSLSNSQITTFAAVFGEVDQPLAAPSRKSDYFWRSDD